MVVRARSLTVLVAALLLLTLACGRGTYSPTLIENGGDRGIPGVADVPGDCVAVYFCDGFQQTTASNMVTTLVSVGFDISPVSAHRP